MKILKPTTRIALPILVFLSLPLTCFSQSDSKAVFLQQMEDYGIRFTSDNKVELLMSGQEKFGLSPLEYRLKHRS